MSSMELLTLGVDRLKPAPYNPRVLLEPGSAGYRRLERSLDEFSLVQPIVWNEQTGHVVSGHQRLEILKDQGCLEVQVVVVSLSLEREKALNITLNNSLVGSDWDTDKLLGIVSELDSLPDFDATLTGFDARDINDLLMLPALMDGDDDGDEVRDVVEVTLEILPENWGVVRPQLDAVIGANDLVVHVKLPQ